MGFFVMGIGKRKTPKAFVNACNVFIYTENLAPLEIQATERRASRKAERGDEGKAPKLDPVPLLKGAYDMAVGDDGWANLGTMGFYLRQLDPGFDPRTYGYKQLSQLIKSYSHLFEIRSPKEPGQTAVYVRLKD
jgi:hypothetical protein